MLGPDSCPGIHAANSNSIHLFTSLVPLPLQVQGLMDIFDRDWCNLYVWTPSGGSGLYHIPRDREYWAACFAVLSDFW